MTAGLSGDQRQDSAVLRARAEARTAERSPPAAGPPTPEEALRLVHELQVHRHELELQSGELWETQDPWSHSSSARASPEAVASP